MPAMYMFIYKVMLPNEKCQSCGAEATHVLGIGDPGKGQQKPTHLCWTCLCGLITTLKRAER
jgi:hypothetical protein